MDVAALERALDQAESVDAEAHKLYNNLGLAHAAKGNYRAALHAHREEKRACQRLAAEPGAPAERLVDLAIAYRRCGDAMLKVDQVGQVLSDSESPSPGDEMDVEITTDRNEIISRAYRLHELALKTAQRARSALVPAADVEEQAAYAAMAHSALAHALESKDEESFNRVVARCREATLCASNLSDEQSGGRKAKTGMIISAAVNLAIAVSGLGEKDRAKVLFQAAGVRARQIGDTNNLIRCLANLAEEAGDDADWQLSLEYVDQWILHARAQKDEGEEADALRKRGAALFELREYGEARTALRRAMSLARDDLAREEAERNLKLVEDELEDIGRARDRLKELVSQCRAAFDAAEPIAEARFRLSAGEAAFRLDAVKEAVEHLGRYFSLVDDYGCLPAATGVDHLRHCAAVANMAEACWRCGRVREAVQWGMRELAVYNDDTAGQAQAWCNIGIYLDDDGNFDGAQEALSKSIALAAEAGDEHLKSRAELNLKVVLANRSEQDGTSLAPHSLDPERNSGPLDRLKRAPEKKRVASSFSSSLPSDIQRPNVTKDNDADRSSMGMRRYVDLATVYQKHCMSNSPYQARLAARDVILERLRAVSARLVAENEDVVQVNLMGTFVEDNELQPLIRTLSALPMQEPSLSLDLSLNPLFAGSSFRWLSSSGSMRSPPALPSVVELNLSGTSLEASSLKMLVPAMEPSGVLSQVRTLSVANNGLGKDPVVSAEAGARLMVRSVALESLDISLNMLPNTFLGLIVDNVEDCVRSGLTSNGGRLCSPKLENLCMRLNNRRAPSALLEVGSGQSSHSRTLRRLFSALPSIRLVDVRACGASESTRRELFGLSKELSVAADMGSNPFPAMYEGPRLLVVSPGVYDANESSE